MWLVLFYTGGGGGEGGGNEREMDEVYGVVFFVVELLGIEALFVCSLRSGDLRTKKLKTHLHENAELKRSPFKAWGKSVYSHSCYAYCQEFLPCLFLPF